MPLTPTLIRWLQTPAAAPWLAQLTAQPPTDAELLATLMRLRRHLTPAQAAAVVETARLRQRAQSKFPAQAGRMFFSRTAYQQASSALVAAYTARRFRSYDWVGDWGCGLGADSLALAAHGPVLALDRDAVALALTQANAAALGLDERLWPVRGDVRHPPTLPPAVWADPGRRTASRRLFDPESLHPPLSALLAQQRHTPDLGIKLMPGLPHQAIPPTAEAEWISLQGALKEAVLWLGGLCRQPGRRATVLPAQASIASEGAVAPVAAPGAYLFEPDAAVIRAGAVGDLASRYHLWQFDAQIAYLSGDAALDTPFTRRWTLLEHHPFDLKTLNKRLRALQGRVTAVKKRGSAIEPEAFRRRLAHHPQGQPLVVVLTRLLDRPWMLICSERQP